MSAVEPIRIWRSNAVSARALHRQRYRFPLWERLRHFVTAFDQLGLSEPLLRAVHASGYETATPIQLQAIPAVLSGRDIMGCAQTGTALDT